jgi:hypothetical protein
MHVVSLDGKTHKEQLQHGTCFGQAVLHHTLTAQYVSVNMFRKHCMADGMSSLKGH